MYILLYFKAFVGGNDFLFKQNKHQNFAHSACQSAKQFDLLHSPAKCNSEVN